MVLERVCQLREGDSVDGHFDVYAHIYEPRKYVLLGIFGYVQHVCGGHAGPAPIPFEFKEKQHLRSVSQAHCHVAFRRFLQVFLLHTFRQPHSARVLLRVPTDR